MELQRQCMLRPLPTGTRQAFVPGGGHRTGPPGKHVIGGKAKYRVLDEKVRYFVSPGADVLNVSAVSGSPRAIRDDTLTLPNSSSHTLPQPTRQLKRRNIALQIRTFHSDRMRHMSHWKPRIHTPAGHYVSRRMIPRHSRNGTKH